MAVSLMALVHAQHPRAMVFAAAMLADRERSARTAAIEALRASGRADVAEPVLRLRLECGEEEPELCSDCMAALLEFAPEDNLVVVGAYLDARDASIAEAAALAIGSSRVPGAFELLHDHVARCLTADRRRIFLLALAMLRSDVAWQYLSELVLDEPEAIACAALDALATFKHDDALRERVEGVAIAKRLPESPTTPCIKRRPLLDRYSPILWAWRRMQ